MRLAQSPAAAGEHQWGLRDADERWNADPAKRSVCFCAAPLRTAAPTALIVGTVLYVRESGCHQERHDDRHVGTDGDQWLVPFLVASVGLGARRAVSGVRAGVLIHQLMTVRRAEHCRGQGGM